MRWGPAHLNANILCAVDIRVGGDDPFTSDLLEICVLPISCTYKVSPHFTLFNVKMRPNWPIDQRLAGLSDPDVKDYKQSGVQSEAARGMFERWFTHTLQPMKHKKIMPLVWDWAAQKPWLKLWLGSSFDEIFHENVRDCMTLLNFINDRYDKWGDKDVPFKQPTFTQLLTRQEITLIERNSVLANCKALQEAYYNLLRGYIPGYTEAPK